MATANLKAIQSAHPQLVDHEFEVVAPGDPRISIQPRADRVVWSEGPVPGPTFLVIGNQASVPQIERLANRYAIPVGQLLAALVLS